MTGLDYADQRYFAGTLAGRFLTADPYEASGGASSPGSWGRYAYVGGDPVNKTDRLGLKEDDFPGGCGAPGTDFCIADGPGMPALIPPTGPPPEGGGPPGDALPTGIGVGGTQIGSGTPSATSVSDKELRERLRTAIEDALNALYKKPGCRALFGGAIGPEEVLGGIGTEALGEYGRIDFASMPVMPGVSPNSFAVTSAVITPLGTRQVPDGFGGSQGVTSTVQIMINSTSGSFVSGTDTDRAVTILHELGHAFNMIHALGGAPGIVSDARNISLSEGNSKRIKNACF